jgi:hypothetical protein
MHQSRVPRSISSQAVRAASHSSPPTNALDAAASKDDASGDNLGTGEGAPAVSASPPANTGESLRSGSSRPPGPSAGVYRARSITESTDVKEQRSSAPPTSRRIPARGPSLPAARPSAAPDPRREPSTGPVSPRTRVTQECEAEAKVVNAWMMGEADRSFVEKARVFSSKVVQLFPHNPRIRFCHACLEKRAENYETAIREFARVLELDPSNVDAQGELDQLLERQKLQRRAQKRE